MAVAMLFILQQKKSIYSSDHGSHFRTRNRDEHLCGGDDYKRSCHSACLHVPLVIAGPGFEGGKRVRELVSTAGLPKTILAAAGVDVGDAMAGENLKEIAEGNLRNHTDRVFAQISESRVGRCIHTRDWLYSIHAPGLDGNLYPSSDYYEEDFLYDLKNDPFELTNLAKDDKYRDIRAQLAKELQEEMKKAGEKVPVIAPSK